MWGASSSPAQHLEPPANIDQVSPFQRNSFAILFLSTNKLVIMIVCISDLGVFSMFCFLQIMGSPEQFVPEEYCATVKTAVHKSDTKRRVQAQADILSIDAKGPVLQEPEDDATHPFPLTIDKHRSPQQTIPFNDSASYTVKQEHSATTSSHNEQKHSGITAAPVHHTAGEWRCDFCTYENPNPAEKCEMCSRLREVWKCPRSLMSQYLSACVSGCVD